jgi:DNA-binding transcriptional ArsR family regulator
MRALAHPTRIRLMEELTLRGPMTATEAAEYVGESPSSCSFHLRTLAKYGFVEEAEGGTGRRRPWRVVAVGTRWESGPDTEAATRAAGDLLNAQVRRRDAELLDEHLTRRDELPAEWQAVVFHANFGGWLTPDELGEIGNKLLELWQPYLDRLRDPSQHRPAGSRLVHMTAHGFPRADSHDVHPAPTTGEDDDDA